MRSLIYIASAAAILANGFGCSDDAVDESGGAAGGSGERIELPKADAPPPGSCRTATRNYCGRKSSKQCWCDAECTTYNDCCWDYRSACGGGSGGSGGGSDAGTPACDGRQGGAFVTLGNTVDTEDGPDQIRLWITDSAFIDEAIQHRNAGTWRIAAFGRVEASPDCDPKKPWHVEPSLAEWADMITEECDATMTYVTKHLSEWVDRTPPNWCPWGGRVIAVDDRR